MKRTLDLFLVLLFAFVFAIPMLILAIAQKCLLGSPILFHQKRIGQHGRPFYIHKFRTMKLGEESDQKRITRWGGFLRSTSLDELPELWNVFIGEMSFVGPRPEVPVFVSKYSANQLEILEAKPGITDLASIYFRNMSNIIDDANPENSYLDHVWKKKNALRLEYVKNRCFKLDLIIIWRTLLALKAK